MDNTNETEVEQIDDGFLNDLSLVLAKEQELYTDYKDDIINTMFEDEEITMILKKDARLLAIRKQLIKLMKVFARQSEFFTSTLHLAVRLLDRYLNDYELSDDTEHQKFVALVTMVLAAKSEDIDDKIPSIKELLYVVCLESLVDLEYRPEENYSDAEMQKAHREYLNVYCRIEFAIFESSQFSTIRPTAVTFINTFEDIMLTEEDLFDMDGSKDQYAIATVDDLKFYAIRHLRVLLNTSLMVIDFQTLLPSKLAASIMAGVRILMGIKTVWTERLKDALRCEYEDIEVIVNALVESQIDSDDEDNDYEVQDNDTSKNCDCSEIGDSGCYSNVTEESSMEI